MTRATYNAAVLGLLILGCSVKSRPLPSANYLAEDGAQAILVQGTKIRFSIRLDNDRTNLVDQTYKNHSIWSNGRVQPFTMTSQDAFLGVGKFEWFWDGTNIIRKGRTTNNETMTFFGPGARSRKDRE